MRVSGRLVLKEESSYCFRPHSYEIHEEYYRLALCIRVNTLHQLSRLHLPPSRLIITSSIALTRVIV